MMSEPQTPASDGETEQVDSPTTHEPETPGSHSGQTPPRQEQSRRTGGKALGLIALLVALCALALAAWQWWSQQAADDATKSRAEPAIEAVQARLADIEQTLARHDQSLEQFSDLTSDDSLNSRLGALLDRRLNDRLEPINRQAEDLGTALNEATERANDVQSTISALEAAVAAGERQREQMAARIERAAGVQREVDQELALRLALLEAAALLRFGQTQAELTGDYNSATAAFRHAQSLLESNADPRLGQTRQRLSAELDALESSRQPDWAAAQLRLTRLSDQVGSWPLAATESETASQVVQADSDDGWWAGMKRSMGQLVEVERRDPLDLDAEQVSALREQLRLRLVAAELAIERRDIASVRRHLGLVDERMERHFDLSNGEVSEARTAIEETRSLRPADPPADLGRALASLNQVLESL